MILSKRHLLKRSIDLRKFSLGILWVLIFIHPLSLKADPVTVKADMVSINILSSATYFIDPSGQLTIDEIIHKQFVPFVSSTVQNGFTSDALWIRFQLKNPLPVVKACILEFNFKELDYLDLYEYQDDKLVAIRKTGDMRLSTIPEENTFFPLFNLELTPDFQRTFFCKIQSSSSVYFDLILWDQIAYLQYMNMHDKFLWLFIGIQLIRLIYIFIIARFMRSQYFTRYSLVILVLVSGIIINSVNMKPAGIPAVIYNMLMLSIYYLLPAAIIYLVWHLLRLDKKDVFIRSLFKFFLSLAGLGFVLMFFYVHQYWFVHSTVIYLVSVFIILLFIMLLVSWRNRDIKKELLIPVFFLIICQIPYSLISLNILPFNQILLVIIPLMLIMEVISTSILIGILIRRSMKSNLEATRNLMNMRDKISADLHDELGSVLTQISIQSELVKNNLYSENEKDNELKKIGEISRQAIHSMSDFVWNVKPENDTWISLIDRMRDHTDIMLLPSGIVIQVEVTGVDEDAELEGGLRQELFLIFKEAITNILRHAEAKQVNIRIQVKPNFLLSVKNDITRPQMINKIGGNGLKNIHKRALGKNLNVSVQHTEDSFEILIFTPV